MSAIKTYLEESDMKKVEEIIVNEYGLGIEDVDLYNRTGGDETYEMWLLVYGNNLSENWLNNYDGDGTDAKDLYIQNGVYVLSEYIKWLKQFCN